MSELAQLIRDEIAVSGPMRFSRFMDLALYHPQYGYYRRRQDPFGREGDFFTAEQLQPVFGRLIASLLRDLASELGTGRATVVEIGAGRREMADALGDFEYVAVDVDGGDMPGRFTGIVFTNEFFDAVPVDLVVRRGGDWYDRRVALEGATFVWNDDLAATAPRGAEVAVRELQSHRVEALRRIASMLERGYIVTIDYGYTHRELIRFPEGTLMSYRRHTASEDVLEQPGERDITAHVDFTELQEQGREMGLETVRFESFASALLRAGERDHFASALEGAHEAERNRYGLQLKSLLFGMGETFRVLVQSKGMGSK